MRTFTKHLVALVALAGAAGAQDLDADVQRDPAADLAIYTLHVDGPPGGSAFLFGGLSIVPPYQFPSVLFPLYIDPFAVVGPIGPQVFLGPTGQFQYQFFLPMQQLEHVHLHFQVIAVDPAFQLAATNLVSAIQGAAPPAVPINLEWSGSYRTNPNVYTLKLMGQPGANVRLLVNGGQKAEGLVVLDENGEGTITLPVNLDEGDGLSIENNGQPVHGWSWD